MAVRQAPAEPRSASEKRTHCPILITRLLPSRGAHRSCNVRVWTPLSRAFAACTPFQANQPRGLCDLGGRVVRESNHQSRIYLQEQGVRTRTARHVQLSKSPTTFDALLCHPLVATQSLFVSAFTIIATQQLHHQYSSVSSGQARSDR